MNTLDFLVIFLWMLPLVSFGAKLFASTLRAASNNRMLHSMCAIALLLIGGDLSYSKKASWEGGASVTQNLSEAEASRSQTSAAPLHTPHSSLLTLDTDGDGIPDIYERWTHSDPFVADSHLDRDGDGLTDLQEYQYRTDPRRADTDNDGLTDWEETLHPLAEEYALNPLAKETFAANEPDLNGDGISDIWEGTPYILGFVDANNDGIPDGVSGHLPVEALWNFDVVATVSSSRTAALVWGDAEGSSYGVVLPPCTNLQVRVRLNASNTSYVRLRAAPEGVTLEGLWKSSLALSLDKQRIQKIERNRVRTGNGTLVEHNAEASKFIGFIENAPALQPAMLSGFGAQKPAIAAAAPATATGSSSPAGTFTLPRIYLSDDYPRCRIHSPYLVVTASVENVSMPLRWSVNGGSEFDGGTVLTRTNASSQAYIYCKEPTWSYDYSAYDGKTFVNGICDPTDTLEIRGAAWSSTHSHTDASDHLPKLEETFSVSGPTPQCPTSKRTIVTIGFRHTLSFLNTRNLIYIGRDELDKTDHCMGVIWQKGGKINLWNLLDFDYLPYKNRLEFKTNNSRITTNGELEHGDDAPEDLLPRICHIQVVDKEAGNKMLDQLWIVINSHKTIDEYSKWRGSNTSLAWTANLPQPFSSISDATGVIIDPEPGAPNNWSAPARNGSLLHHNAAYTMRSRTVDGQYGHQAAYDADGKLITSTIAAGTADIVAPTGPISANQHRLQDVLPFIRALQLDGNPVRPENGTILPNGIVPTSVSRPCLYQGSNTDTYISLRPITPTGVQTR